MQTDQGERRWDWTDLFLWWTCVYMSFRAEHQASLIVWVSQTSRVWAWLALTKRFPPVLAKMLCVISTHTDACMTTLLAMCDIYVVMPDTGKFKVSSAFACMFLTFLSCFLPFHCCLEVGHVQAARALTPLIYRGAEGKHKSYFWVELCAN